MALTRRTAVIVAIAAAAAAVVAVVIAVGPTDRRRAPAPQTHYVAAAGDPIEVAAERGPCFAPMLEQLRARPNWSLRVDDMHWSDVDPEPLPRRGAIVIDAAAGVWTDDHLVEERMDLTAGERDEVLAALALDCTVDENAPRNGFWGRYATVAYGATADAAVRFPTRSPAAMRLGAAFDAIRARYVANRLPSAATVRLELHGQRRTGPGEWTPYTLTYDAASSTAAAPGFKVMLMDWALGQAASLPDGRSTARGTLTIEGVARPIAVSLAPGDPEGTFRYEVLGFSELTEWMSINVE